MSKNSAPLLQDVITAPAEDPGATRRLDLYKFYQERVETIRTRLWTTLTWLAAAQGASLVFAVRQGEIRSARGPELFIGQPVLVFFLAVFGMLLAFYTVYVVEDGIKHIKSNWSKSDFVVKTFAVEYTASNPEFPAFGVMKWLAYMALVAHAVIGILGVLAIADWLGLDFSWLRVGLGNSTVIEPPPAQ